MKCEAIDCIYNDNGNGSCGCKIPISIDEYRECEQYEEQDELSDDESVN